MPEQMALITRWIVVFLVIFLLCMLLVFSWVRRKTQTVAHR
jgi:Mg2+ and Co2+ transporter CorA